MISTVKTKVYALFDDGSADEIIFSYFGAPQSQSIPIRAYSNDIQDIDVQRSVLDGTSAALASYEKAYKSTGVRYCFAYKFSKDSTNNAVTGTSAGLAFCIRFALKMYKDLIRGELNFSVGATGIIEIDEDLAQIKPVDKINKKFEAALNSLSADDLFFYPAENEHEIDEQIQAKIIKNGITVHAVQNVYQVINILFAGHLDKPEGKSNNFWFISFAVFIIFFVGGYFLISNNKPACYEQIIKELESGRYKKAKEISELCLEQAENDSLQNLLNKINSELRLSADFIYIKDNIPNKSRSDDDSPLLMGTDDGYRFVIQSATDCFVYIFQFDSEAHTERLFPLSSFILKQHYVQKSKIVKIPGGENMFYLDNKDHHGRINIFLIATWWPLKELEDTYNQYEDSQESKTKRELYNRLIKIITQYSELKNSHFTSLFIKELTFIQQ